MEENNKKELTLVQGIKPVFTYIKQTLGDNLTGVEVGVYKGHGAVYLMSVINPKMLYVIDPWFNFFDPDSGDVIGETHYIATTALLSSFPCCKIMRMTSFEAADKFQNGELDFVYIDGDHSHQAVFSDILRWYPKVKKGGILSGHDFPIVKQAVIDACTKLNLTQATTQNEDWWVMV